MPERVALVLVPLVIHWLYPPEIKRTPDAAPFAHARLQQMGPLRGGEKILLGVFALLLLA